jgi:hypothetical protein
MRVFLISLPMVILFLLPDVVEVKNWTLPGIVNTIAFIPHAGLGYMTVFFHELGHTITSWSYGEIAIPAFNFRDGGGVSVPLFPRTWILQAPVYAGAIFLCWVLWSDGYYGLLISLLALLAVHAGFSTGEHYQLPVSYMGNGGAMLMGCFCIYRAALNKVVTGAGNFLERYMHMIFGLFAVLGKGGLILAWQLMTSDIARSAYNEGIGETHMANDFTVIADRLDCKLEHVGAFHMLFTLVSLAVMGWLIFTGWQAEQETLEDDEADVLRRLPTRKS